MHALDRLWLNLSLKVKSKTQITRNKNGKLNAKNGTNKRVYEFLNWSPIKKAQVNIHKVCHD